MRNSFGPITALLAAFVALGCGAPAPSGAEAPAASSVAAGEYVGKVSIAPSGQAADPEPAKIQVAVEPEGRLELNLWPDGKECVLSARLVDNVATIEPNQVCTQVLEGVPASPGADASKPVEVKMVGKVNKGTATFQGNGVDVVLDYSLEAEHEGQQRASAMAYRFVGSRP